MNEEKALKDWVKTQSLPVSNIEEHGFINGYRWAFNELKRTPKEQYDEAFNRTFKEKDGSYTVNVEGKAEITITQEKVDD